MQPGQLSLIVSTYNGPDALEKVFEGLERQTALPGEILVSDDGSGPATRQLVEQWKERLNVPLRHVWHEDQGFRKTVILNKTAATTSNEYLVTLDGDCVPHKDYIRDHAALAERGFWVQARRCFVSESSVSEFKPGQTSVSKWLISGRITGVAKALRLPFPIVLRNQEQRGIIGCNMAFWRDDLIAVNGFDEEYTGWGIGEDSDLGTRLFHLGRPRKFVYANAIVYHLNHPEPPKDHVKRSKDRLALTLQSRKVKCERGIDQYL